MFRIRKRKLFSQKAFTLVEILIALAIIGIIVSFVGVNAIRKYKESMVQAAKIQIAAFSQALQSYYLAHSMYPHTSQGLEALIRPPSVGRIPKNYPQGGYLDKKEIVNDPWGNPYRYECEDYQNFVISSDGPDGEPGTQDDIRNE